MTTEIKLMIPTGDFDKFETDILCCYNVDDCDEVTFGILIADPRQTDAREYIYNYLRKFHKKSGNLFDFFIPGYDPVDICPNVCVVNYDEPYYIELNKIGYVFNENLFEKFCDTLEEYFGIRQTFNPTLILMSIRPGHINTAKYIVIELDDNEFHNVRRSGMFFMDLFSAVRANCNLQHIQSHMIGSYIKGNLLDSIINAISGNWLDAIKPIGKEIQRFRMKSYA